VTLGEWHLTGDLAKRDAEGYVWFVSRDDDLIITSGYRVAPREVEETILEHAAVEQVGVVGVPTTREERSSKRSSSRSRERPARRNFGRTFRDLVRERLAAYEYPREIEFVDELPTTTTGKIRRTELG